MSAPMAATTALSGNSIDAFWGQGQPANNWRQDLLNEKTQPFFNGSGLAFNRGKKMNVGKRQSQEDETPYWNNNGGHTAYGENNKHKGKGRACCDENCTWCN